MGRSGYPVKGFTCPEQDRYNKGCPYLAEHRIHARSPKQLYFQVLFYPFEEQLNLPSSLVYVRYILCRHLHIVGDKFINVMVFLTKLYQSISS
jgi:hypothetical protein